MKAQKKLALMRDRRSRFKQNHGTDQHELDLIACFPPDEYEGTLGQDPVLALVVITPTPHIVSKPMKSIELDDTGKGAAAVAVHTYEVTDISRLNYTESQLREALYFVVVPRGQVVNAADVPNDKRFVKYELLGSIEQMEKFWKITLKQMKG